METQPTIELLHPEEYYEHQQWYQVNYCSVCGVDTGVNGPDCCDFCDEADDHYYEQLGVKTMIVEYIEIEESITLQVIGRLDMPGAVLVVTTSDSDGDRREYHNID